jgi:hypothetical protein
MTKRTRRERDSMADRGEGECGGEFDCVRKTERYGVWTESRLKDTVCGLKVD